MGPATLLADALDDAIWGRWVGSTPSRLSPGPSEWTLRGEGPSRSSVAVRVLCSSAPQPEALGERLEMGLNTPALSGPQTGAPRAPQERVHARSLALGTEAVTGPPGDKCLPHAPLCNGPWILKDLEESSSSTKPGTRPLRRICSLCDTSQKPS